MADIKSFMDEYEKKTSDIDERVKKLDSKLNRQIYGIGNEVMDLTNISSDYMRYVNKDNTKNNNSVTKLSTEFLSNITGRDINENTSIQDVLMKTLEDLPYISQIDPNMDQIASLELEYNFICAQMPQLIKSLEAKSNNVINPDGISKKRLNCEIVDYGTDKNRLTQEHVDVVIEKLEKDSWNIVMDTFKSGNIYYLVIPLKELAKNIDNRYQEKKKVLISQSYDDDIEMYSESSREILDGDTNEIDIFNDTSKPKMFAEGVAQKKPTSNDIQAMLKGKYKFSNNHLTHKAKSAVFYKMSMVSESLEKKSNRDKFKNLTGVHYERLDVSRTIPVIIANDLVGVYYVDEVERKNVDLSYEVSNMTSSQYLSDVTDGYHKRYINQLVVDKISDVVRRNLDSKFIKDNKDILGALDNVLRKSTRLDEGFKIRFIPKKYLVHFAVNKGPNGIGRSQLHRARTMAHVWILLNYNTAMNKLFFEKDKLWVKAKMSEVSTDIAQYAMNSLRSISKIYPLPNDILNLNKTYGFMSDIGRIITPVDSSGEPSFTLDRIQGQVAEDNSDYKKEIENIATSLVGVPFSLNEMMANAEFATQILSTNKLEVMDTLLRQIEFEDSFSELATKIINYEYGLDIEASIKLPRPRALSETVNSETLRNVKEKADNITEVLYSDDEDKKSYVTKALFRKETLSSIDWAFIESVEKEYESARLLNDEEE